MLELRRLARRGGGAPAPWLPAAKYAAHEPVVKLLAPFICVKPRRALQGRLHPLLSRAAAAAKAAAKAKAGAAAAEKATKEEEAAKRTPPKRKSNVSFGDRAVLRHLGRCGGVKQTPWLPLSEYRYGPVQHY